MIVTEKQIQEFLDLEYSVKPSSIALDLEGSQLNKYALAQHLLWVRNGEKITKETAGFTNEVTAEEVIQEYTRLKHKITQDKFQEDLNKKNPKDFSSVFSKLFK